MQRSAVKLSFGLFDNLDFSVELGEANGRKWSGRGKLPIENFVVTDFPKAGDTAEIRNSREESVANFKAHTGFLYGFGLKGVYPLENNWLLGIQTLYLRHKNNLKCTYHSKIVGAYEITAGPDSPHSGTYTTEEKASNWKAEVTIQEWQIAPYIAYKIENFTPYLGVKYSDQRIKYKNEGNKTKIKADDNFGVFVGTDYKITELDFKS